MNIFSICILSHLILWLAMQANSLVLHSKNLRKTCLYLSLNTIEFSFSFEEVTKSYLYLIESVNNWKIENLIEIRKMWRFVLDLINLKILKLKATVAWNACRRRIAPVQEHERNCYVILMKSRTNHHVFLI